MKKFLLPAVALLASLSIAQAQYFTPGNLAVLRVSGFDSTTSPGAAIIIDQYTTSGTLVSSYAVPTNGANALCLSGLTYAGLMTLTPDNAHLVIPGYNIAVGAAGGNVNFTTSATAPRSIGILDAYGNFSLPIANSTVFNGFTLTGVASDGTNYWMHGNGPSGEFTTGVYPQCVYVGTAAAGATVQVATNVFSSGTRGLNVYYSGGAYGLYGCGFSSNAAYNTTGFGSGGFLYSNISGALPKSATTSSNYFPDGTSSAGTGCDLAINPSGTIAYLADLSFGVVKFSNSGSGWVSNYTVQLTNAGFITAQGKEACSVTADWSQSPPVVYATTVEAATNRLVKFQDTGANPTVVNLAMGNISGVITNTFRGVRFVPLPVPAFTSQPASVVANPGISVTFHSSATGIPAPSFQWYSNSVANPTFVAVSGGTSSNLTLNSVTLAQSGSSFYVIASNTYGTAQSAVVTLTVNDPAIIQGVVGATNFPGSPGVNLSVSAVGTSLTYQWLSNGVPIAGANSSSYTTPGSLVAISTLYSVIISNSLGNSITNGPATVAYSPYLLNDTFSYAGTNLFTAPGSPWTDINGTLPELLTGGRVQVSQTNATTDARSLFSQTVADGSTILWASFTINMSSLPTNTGGTYFANFEDTNFGFFSCIYALSSNAFPGTYRLGIANTNLDYSATTGKGGPKTQVCPVDLALGIDYQVVFAYDMVNEVSYMAVNPNLTTDVDTTSFENDANTIFAGDSFKFPTNALAGFGLRQRGGEGSMLLDNLEVSLDTTVGAATICGYCAVTANVTPQQPVIGFLSGGFTNYTGSSNVLKVAASAIGSGINPAYYWYKNTVGSPGTYNQITDSGDFLGSATDTLQINPLAAGDAGTYYVVVSNSVGGTQSSNIVVSVITTPTAPFFVTPTNATNISVALGGSVTFTSLASGSGPITYDWKLNGGDLGVTTPSLNLSGLLTNQSGTYTVVASGPVNPPATSFNFVLTVLPPTSTNISYLRSLLVTNAAPGTLTLSDTTTEFNITGVVTVVSNLTSGNTASYYLQDSTGGINFFVNDSTFRPALGSVVTATGVLSLFNNNLELGATAGNPIQTYSIVGTNAPLPTPKLLPFGYATSFPGLTAVNLEGSLVSVTNVYFADYTGSNKFVAGSGYVVSNLAGQTYTVFLNSQDQLITGSLIPRFAYSVTGPSVQFNSVFEIDPTRLSDIVTAPPPAVSDLSAVASGTNNITLTWTAIPANYTYSVWVSTNVAGPYAPLPSGSGLWFSNSTAKFTDVAPTNSVRFYEIVSP